MSTVLVLVKQDELGEALGRQLRKAVGAGPPDLRLVASWGDAIRGFLPDPPASFVIDGRLIGGGLPVEELLNIRSEFPGTRVVLLGRPQEVGERELRTLIRTAWIDDILTPEELADPERVARLRDLLQASLAGRIRGALVDARGGRPVPAFVDRAIEIACEADAARIPVLGASGMARQLGVSPRTLTRRLRKGCGMSARDLLSWTRVLRAVAELDRNPEITARDLAALVGYSDPSGLGRAMERTLACRLKGARAMGFAGALEKLRATSFRRLAEPDEGRP